MKSFLSSFLHPFICVNIGSQFPLLWSGLYAVSIIINFDSKTVPCFVHGSPSPVLFTFLHYFSGTFFLPGNFFYPGSCCNFPASAMELAISSWDLYFFSGETVLRNEALGSGCYLLLGSRKHPQRTNLENAWTLIQIHSHN